MRGERESEREREIEGITGCTGSLSHWAAATSMPLSENIEGTTAHFILNSIHCCSRTPLPPLSICLSAGGHVNTCRKPFANPPLHTQLKRSSASFLVAVVVAVGRVSKLPNFFGFSSAVSFLFFLCFCLLHLRLPLAACRCPAEAINVLSCQRSAAAAVRNCYGQKRNSGGNNKQAGRVGEGWMGKVKSGKWKNPMRKNAKSICCAR